MYFLWTKRKNPELSVLGISIRPLIPRVAVFSAVRCCTFLPLLCILIVGIHASRISNPPSLLMLLGSYVNSFLYPTSVPVRISINKLDLIPDTAIVRPKLEYACAAWDPYLQRDINSRKSTGESGAVLHKRLPPKCQCNRYDPGVGLANIGATEKIFPTCITI